MNYDSVIFDLDGTLLNTLDDLCDSMNYALSAHGKAERSLSEIRAFVGNGIGELARLSCGEDEMTDEVLAVLDTFKIHYKDNSQNKTCPYEGIPALLSGLKAARVPTAIVSNKVDSAVQTLTEKYFRGVIDVAIGELSGVKRKPAPDTVFLAMEKLGGGKTVYVGDSEVDVETAKNAGVEGLFVTWGFRDEDALRAAGAVNIVRSIEELEAALGL